MSTHVNPTLHLPHFLDKHVLGRKRILIYMQPPVELACILCQVAADICFEDQTALDSVEGATVPRPRLMGKQKEGINVLGVVTLHDIGRLERELETGRGWVACAFFVELCTFAFLTVFFRM